MTIPKKVKKVWDIISTIVVILVVVIAMLLVGVRIFGLSPFTVLSGSMEPTYLTGSLIYVKEVDPSEVQVRDPITFVLNVDLVVATHRVVEIDEENQYFYTKGDANDAVDGSRVHFNNLIGVPVFTIPGLGYVANYIQNPPGMYIAIALVAILLIFVVLSFFVDDEEGKKNKERKRKKKVQGSELPDVGEAGK